MRSRVLKNVRGGGDREKYISFKHFNFLPLSLTHNLQNSVLLLYLKFCAKRASKNIVPPNQMLLSFSTGTFSTDYDESFIHTIILHLTKKNKMSME